MRKNRSRFHDRTYSQYDYSFSDFMIDSDTDEFSSQYVSSTIAPYIEQPPVVSSQVYFLRQLANPFRVAWTLIKLGYEPLAPVQFYSPLALFGLSPPIYVYPNFFKYTYHLMKTIGVWKVLSTGLFTNATQDFIGEIFRAAFIRRTTIWMTVENNHFYDRIHTPATTIITTTNSRSNEGFQTERLLEEPKFSVFFDRFIEILSLKFWEVLVSHPFYVVTVRQIAALIGKETQYTWFPMAILSIYRENGILGFFQGFIPRLIGEVILTSAYYCSCRIVRSLIFGLGERSAENMNILRVLLYYTLHNYTYPFELTGCVMAVHGARLVGAAEANSFQNWHECHRYLSVNKQLIRGWRPFLRSHVQNIHLPKKIS
ncbi:Mitochondrial carrier like [Schistosoma japonicum]|nr:Mitochondrial carrier like [Schistosoma japonicum]KAH8872765.1 Mitochondrial carrier like [Schistosoma japonicum]KAH8872766.1 Mitochondrial carrier like [Schistosoma japonicum]KAH8872767.1 Mitochondrial carrier like [Schistosoma japonicum]